MRQHFLDMGVLPGVPITLVKYAPMGDPMELRVHGYELTLRRADARKIEVGRTENGKRKTENFEENGKQPFTFPISDSRFPEPEHPGLGEGGHYHQQQEKARRETENLINGKRKTENGKLLDKTFNVQRSTFNDTPLTFALVGNQNCGKTTLFNQLTGANQHVGNFPGVTVDRKDGAIKGYPNSVVTDLPGIYSLSP